MRLYEFEGTAAPPVEMAPYVPMRRWWVNTASGDVLAVPEDTDHLGYMRGNQTQFGIKQHHKWSEAEQLGKVASQHNWHPATYEGQVRTLTIRFDNGTQKALKRVMQHLIDQLPEVERVLIQVGKKAREMSGERLAHFLGNGRLPAK
jgi:hypothetical protein